LLGREAHAPSQKERDGQNHGQVLSNGFHLEFT
jgi:hypothetical protein